MWPKATAATDAHLDIGILQPGREGIDRLHVAANSDRIDDPHQQFALQRARRPRKALRPRPDRRIASKAILAQDARLLVRQKRHQGGDRFLAAVDGQLLAGDRFLRRGRIQPQDANQRAVLFLPSGILRHISSAARTPPAFIAAGKATVIVRTTICEKPPQVYVRSL